MPKITIYKKHGHIHHVKEDNRHIWSVSYNPSNGIYFIHNTKTSMRWELLASEFVYNSINLNPIVSTFPNYVHGQVWSIDEYRHNEIRRASYSKNNMTNDDIKKLNKRG